MWLFFAFAVCVGGLSLGFGSFQNPKPGFMPFLCGLFLGLLALTDFIPGFLRKWKTEKGDEEIWSGINWVKLVLTFSVLFAYAISLSRLGFILGTTLLLIFLFRIMKPRPFWIILLASGATMGFFYLLLKIVLGIPLPRGFTGF